MTIEFTEGGNIYQTGKLGVFVQFHVARKVAPVLGNLIGIVKGLGTPEEMMGPLTESLAKMSNEDSEYILNECAAVTTRKDSSGAWAKIYVKEAQRFMYPDIDLRVLLVITAKTIQDNLGGFFPELLEKLKDTPDPNQQGLPL